MEVSSLFSIFKGVDNTLAKFNDDVNRRKYLVFLVKMECRYNIDLINSISFSKSKDNHLELRKIIQMLSVEALNRLMEYTSEKDSESFFISKLLEIPGKVRQEFNKKAFNKIEENDPILFNVYKRILVLKSLSQIDPPYECLKDLRFKMRLKNLREVMIVIIKSEIK